MANSDSRSYPGFDPWTPAPRTCGPMGWNDAADPFSLLIGDTPGSCGIGDWGAADEIRKRSLKQVESPAKTIRQNPTNSDFIVANGQITFDAEGNDDPDSLYFSRKIHWPGNPESGVTLGRGYDMGNRTIQEVTTDLVAAGMEPEKAAEFAKGAKKKGPDAKKFRDENREKLGEITAKVQKKLFENCYSKYVERARDNYDKWTFDEDAQIDWDELHPAIKDILVDFVYQGFTKGPKPMQAGMTNEVQTLIHYVDNSPTLKQYEAGRHRVRYLKRYGH